MFWNDNGDQVAITSADDIYILKFAKETLKELMESGENNEDGYEEAFELAHELHESATSGMWINNVFYFTSNSGKINYTVMGKVFNLAHTDKKKFLIGYIPTQNKIYLTDKMCTVVGFDLHNSVPLYFSTVQDSQIE